MGNFTWSLLSVFTWVGGSAACGPFIIDEFLFGCCVHSTHQVYTWKRRAHEVRQASRRVQDAASAPESVH